MKKRILSMILTLTMIMGIFTGCGAGGLANEITVSEMLNSIMEEEGEVVMYTVDKDGDDWTEDYAPSKNTKVWCYVYNGEAETITGMVPAESTGYRVHALGEYLDGTMEIKENSQEIYKKIDLKVVADKDNNALYEELSGRNTIRIRFGAFEREEINGISCMIFATYNFGNEQNAKYAGVLNDVDYIIIADTDYTKDKTVVCDFVGAEGILTETYDSKKETWISTSDKDWTPNK